MSASYSASNIHSDFELRKMSEEHSYFKEILNELGLTYEEYEQIFNEFQKTAAQSKGPLQTVGRWNDNKSREERVAFLKGMLLDYFLRKASEADQIMDEIIES